MKRIKTFESFNIYEGNDAGFLQRDPMVGMKDIVSQIEKKLNEMSDQVMDKLKEATIPKTVVKKIADFMMDTFDTLTPEMNKENVELLSKKLGLANLHVNESFKENENIVIKVLARISQILGMNLMCMTVPAVFIFNKLAETMGYDNGVALPALLSVLLFYLLNKILELFGYNVAIMNKHGYDGFDSGADLVDYNDHVDIRNPNSYPRKSLKNKIDNFKNKIGFSK